MGYRGSVDVYQSIADRRIGEARSAGYFDNLPGTGRPIADLGRQRPPGWWAMRVVRVERDKMRYEELVAAVKAAMPGLWGAGSQEDLRARVAELNHRISAYNATTSYQPLDRLEPAVMNRTWQALRASAQHRRRGPA